MNVSVPEDKWMLKQKKKKKSSEDRHWIEVTDNS